MSKRYFEVLEEFATHVGVDSKKEFLEEQELMIERTVVGFLWEGDEENGDVIFFIRLGAPGAARLQEIALQLLEANYLAAGVGGSTIGVHHDSGEVVISSSINAHGLTGESLAGVIGGFLDTAAQWESVVKGQPDSAAAPASSGAVAPEALTDLQRMSMGLRA
ncbi:CesT family type III secretion system chaperone [Imbroritus primus]|uniref:CesT family type III secretion system chaperone n=1 Tax=Imbroritus primus TaxID=3058603 RepID=UPI003D162034